MPKIRMLRVFRPAVMYRSVVTFLVLVSYSTNSFRLNDLRVKFSWSSIQHDKEDFFRIPRNVFGAYEAGYRVVTSLPNRGLDVTLYCYNRDPTLCPIYDNAGFIAGLQIAVPLNDAVKVPYAFQTTMQTIKIDDENYFITSVLFASPEETQVGRRGAFVPVVEQIWLQHGEDFIQVPILEETLKSLGMYAKGNCLPSIGTHYFQTGKRNETQCENLFPYFPLVKGDKVIGIGLLLFGIFNTDSIWTEMPLNHKILKMAFHDPPACLDNWLTSYGATLWHIYFIEEPWTISCDEHDSIDKFSLAEKLHVNGIRYWKKLLDIFSLFNKSRFYHKLPLKEDNDEKRKIIPFSLNSKQWRRADTGNDIDGINLTAVGL